MEELFQSRMEKLKPQRIKNRYWHRSWPPRRPWHKHSTHNILAEAHAFTVCWNKNIKSSLKTKHSTQTACTLTSP